MWREDFKCHRGGFRSSQHNYPVYAVTIQEKVALENRIESTTSRVKRTTWWTGLMTSQRRSEDAPAADTAAVCAYKKLLEQNVASVNNYRFTNKPKRNSFTHTHTKEFLTIYI
jgi:hypothetical protein